MPIPLAAKTANQARAEIAHRFPQGAAYTGYDEDGEAVLLSLVRAKGDKANVATARKNRCKRPVRFECEPLS